MTGSPTARADGRPPGPVVAAAGLAFAQAVAVTVATVVAAFIVLVMVQSAAGLDVPSGLPVAELFLLAVVQLSSVAALVTGGRRVLRRRDRTSRTMLVSAPDRPAGPDRLLDGPAGLLLHS